MFTPIEIIISVTLSLTGLAYTYQEGQSERKLDATHAFNLNLKDKDIEAVKQCSKACGPGKFRSYSMTHNTCKCFR